MLKINKNTKIYILAPTQNFTGGPTLLHQLGYKLRKNDLNVIMVYHPIVEGTPVHKNYLHLNLPYRYKVEDNRTNIIIVPETMTYYLYRFKKIQKVIWWLSIDNYFKVIENRSIKSKVAYKLRLRRRFTFKTNDVDLHLAQSYYSLDYLKKKNIKNIEYLSDYLSEFFLNKPNTNFRKENIILYNPKKGMDFTKKIKENLRDLKWIALEKMTPEEVNKALSQGKVYIDFGEHPGKDRFPREAAINNCCVITGKKGSAKFYEDVPISEEFKFDDEEDNIPLICNKIRDCIENFDDNLRKQDPYRSFIRKEELNFDNRIKEIFKISTPK